MIVGQSNYCPACGSSDSSLGVNPFLDKKIITDGRKNHLCQTFREMLEKEKEVLVVCPCPSANMGISRDSRHKRRNTGGHLVDLAIRVLFVLGVRRRELGVRGLAAELVPASRRERG